MNREQLLDLLMLLSAIESFLLADGRKAPDYLIERIDDSVEQLRVEVLK